MGSCPQGHPVPVGFDFCGTCGAQIPLEVTSPSPPGSMPDPDAGPWQVETVTRRLDVMARPDPEGAPARGDAPASPLKAGEGGSPARLDPVRVPAPTPLPGSGRPAVERVPAAPRPDMQPTEASARNGLGRTAATLGVLSIITAPAMGLGIVIGVLAVAFGEAGLARVRARTATNRRAAGWGIFLGLVGALVSLALLRYYQLLAESGFILIG